MTSGTVPRKHERASFNIRSEGRGRSCQGGTNDCNCRNLLKSNMIFQVDRKTTTYSGSEVHLKASLANHFRGGNESSGEALHAKNNKMLRNAHERTRLTNKRKNKAILKSILSLWQGNKIPISKFLDMNRFCST